VSWSWIESKNKILEFLGLCITSGKGNLQMIKKLRIFY
jgi:hypothetical protein